MRVRPKRGTPRLRHADTDPYPLRLLSIGDIGSRTRRRRLTGKRTLSMCRSIPTVAERFSLGSHTTVRRGLGGRACARTHESGRAPRRRLVPQPAPPCRGPYAGVQHRHRLRASGVGYSLAPSPTAPSPAASRRAKRSRLRHRWPPPRFPAPPPGGRLRLAPWPDARPCADGALRHGAATAQAVAAPPAHRCRRRRRRSALSISVSRV